MEINNYEVNVFNPGSSTYVYMPIETATAKVLSKRFKDITFVCIDGFDWDDNLTFWQAPNVFENKKPFGGNGKKFLNYIEEEVIPVIEKDCEITSRLLVGYSLGGLFALISAYESKCFDKVASVSGSLWYPELETYMQDHQCIARKVYLSLGEKEKNSKNELMKTVEDKTNNIESILQNTNVETVFVLNQGNHFMNVIERLYKAIVWLMTSEVVEEED